MCNSHTAKDIPYNLQNNTFIVLFWFRPRPSIKCCHLQLLYDIRIIHPVRYINIIYNTTISIHRFAKHDGNNNVKKMLSKSFCTKPYKHIEHFISIFL